MTQEKKFKIGDRVVVTEALFDVDAPQGTTFTIKGPNFFISINGTASYQVNEDEYGYYETQLEFEHVYNSPLMQALK